jgi:PTS system nitrogen regulatory IIA component
MEEQEAGTAQLEDWVNRADISVPESSEVNEMVHTILQALEDGRVIELPDNDKKDAFEVLASLLEAVPSVPAGTDIVGAVLSRESSSSTSMGNGWACPHAPVSFDGDLLCSIGWSPQGLDYGKPGEPLVRLIIMFMVPDNQRSPI